MEAHGAVTRQMPLLGPAVENVDAREPAPNSSRTSEPSPTTAGLDGGEPEARVDC